MGKTDLFVDEFEYASQLFKMGKFTLSDFGFYDINDDLKNKIKNHTESNIAVISNRLSEIEWQNFISDISNLTIHLKLRKIKKKIKKTKKKIHKLSLYIDCNNIQENDFFTYQDYYSFITYKLNVLKIVPESELVKINILKAFLDLLLAEYKNLLSSNNDVFYSCSSCKLSDKTNLSLQELFLEKHTNYKQFIDVLVNCSPPLLSLHNNTYSFIGNSKTQKSCVGYYFNVLRRKGILKPDLNRDYIASILSNCIGNFSISGPSVQNFSNTYSSVFEMQFDKEIIKLTNNI